MAKLPKAPKRPKASASVAVWERYDARVKEHGKKVAEIRNNAKKKIALMKKTTAAISGIGKIK